MHCAYDARLQTKEGIGRKEMIAPDRVGELKLRVNGETHVSVTL